MKRTLKRTYWLEAMVGYNVGDANAVDLFYTNKEEMLADVEYYKTRPDCVEIAWGEVGRGNAWGNVWQRYPEQERGR